ncbi:MAG: aspartate kinase [Verrucomicrobia bacterium]|nr:aspartate kinase [Verrucomicrobiota bacterium]
MKFGGAATESSDRFSAIADLIVQRQKEAGSVVVVVSAVGNTTDQLMAMAKTVHPSPPSREVDMLISVGERISAALLAMALALRGKEAISLTGSQSGIITTSRHTDAKILEVRPARIQRHLEEGKIVIVAGYQGVSRDGEITTLGRGGSDTTAVALGISLQAEKVEFYSQALPMEQLNYVEAYNLTLNEASTLHARCVALAAKNFLPLQLVSFAKKKMDRTLIGSLPRRLVTPVYEED